MRYPLLFRPHGIISESMLHSLLLFGDWSLSASFAVNIPFLFPRKGGPTALHCAHRTSTFLVCAFCEQEELWAILSYPPGPADLYVCTIDVAGLIAQEIADGCYRIFDGTDVAGWDAFGHAGEFSRRRTA